jgi:hypothetical protein
VKRALAIVAVAAALLAGCTGVPRSSAPETIEPVDTAGTSPTPTRATCLDCHERDIVTHFLDANAGTHATATQYLTPAASSRWSDDTATIIGNDYSVSTYNSRKQTVVVSGRVLGTLSVNGIYTPSLLGAGSGGEKQAFIFHLVHLTQGSRIDKLPAGLLLTDTQFRETYRQEVLYFDDRSERALVPDLRWSALGDDRQLLAEWLLRQIVVGPRPDLVNAVSVDTMPAHVDPTQITVQLGSPTLIEIPGSTELDQGVRDRLAAQVSHTLDDALAGGEMTITDGGTPILIPHVTSDTFTAAEFASAAGPQAPTSEVFYLNDGQIRDEGGKVLSGGIAADTTLSSFAVSQAAPGRPLLVAGVTGSGSAASLWVGTRSAGLHSTTVHGALSRPAFVPGRDEVWIGVGSALFRVVMDGSSVQTEPVPMQAVSGGGQVVAIRFSPEGSRVAIVVAGAQGAKQLYIGSIVRGGGHVRVDSLEAISPTGVVVTDVAWLDSFKLFAIGYLAATRESRTFETGVDGTDWTSAGTGGLPDRPDSVTAATSSSVWVSASGFVWKQSGNSWTSAGSTGQTAGTSPVYLE